MAPKGPGQGPGWLSTSSSQCWPLCWHCPRRCACHSKSLRNVSNQHTSCGWRSGSHDRIQHPTAETLWARCPRMRFIQRDGRFQPRFLLARKKCGDKDSYPTPESFGGEANCSGAQFPASGLHSPSQPVSAVPRVCLALWGRSRVLQGAAR